MIDFDLGVTWVRLTDLRVGVGSYGIESGPRAWSGVHTYAKGIGDGYAVMWTGHKVDQ